MTLVPKAGPCIKSSTLETVSVENRGLCIHDHSYLGQGFCPITAKPIKPISASVIIYLLSKEKSYVSLEKFK